MSKIFFGLLFLITSVAFSQKPVLNIKSFEFGVYDYNPAKDKFTVIIFCAVKNNGEVQVQYDEGGKPQVFAIQLEDSIQKKINSLFEVNKGVKDLYKKGMETYNKVNSLASYYYLQLTTSDNKKEEISYRESYMKDAFNSLIQDIIDQFFNSQHPVIKESPLVSDIILNRIRAVHKKKNYKSGDDIPEISEQQ